MTEPSGDFRFLALCHFSYGTPDEFTLENIVNHLTVNAFPWTVRLRAYISVCCCPATAGCRLNLHLWQRSGNGHHHPLPCTPPYTYQIPSTAPDPLTVPIRIDFPLSTPGDYGADLLDLDGAFGPPSARIASFKFSVDCRKSGG